ncbi:MAG: sigma-54-dependent Fis family transcriptional regulator [Planctomycetes bacterium]|nr:sigma-54-dependent Fis family transcriptional regulator [Planctomycetota bacterium]MCB9826257.1 sigma-54-dependent Fis family transcriptional regulator [Planctomycetota bacterium]MCB9828975.1 sigma-54-dependent Fis family transcriptional regulator [Planctomycetota bacterium]MCB9901830.1 sigma-54-dependent Fis family transcriptional regulator [Planctomycetota bacterium]
MRILVVDDEEAIRESLDLVLRFEHHDVVTASNGQEGLDALAADETIELVFLDIKMPGRDGLEILGDMRERRPDATVVMISGHGTIDTAMEATRKGAFDFLEKPLDRDRVLLVVRNAHQVRRLQGENRILRTRLSATSREMIGSSPALHKVRTIIQKVAPTQARVLIMGENGSGKELAARLVHELSDRSAGPFVDVNCAAIPAELLESELFGHEKGSFTGAVDQRKGKFEQADGGTLFLDEVGDMSLDAQAKVLRVIEEQRVQRVGGSQPIPVDVRLVAATNKDLRKEVDAGHFREDLYYRLAVVPVLIPPLRDRAQDVPVLAMSFLQQMASKMGVPVPELAEAAKAWLERQPWPGNVRQLRNLMERALILLEGNVIEVKDLEGLGSPSAAAAGGSMDLFKSATTYEEFKEQSERLFLQQRLQENEWNVKRTAEQLGMQRSNLYKKMERYGLK